jgi:hypothetical protein
MHERMSHDARVEIAELFGVGQLSIDEQERDFDEGGSFGELFDRVAAVAQDPLATLDLADARGRGTGVHETGIVQPNNRRHADQGHEKIRQATTV